MKKLVSPLLLTASFACAVLALSLIPASPASADTTVEVLMTTERGDITIELYPDAAPVSVGNFLRYVDGAHYDGASFYRSVRYDNDNGNPKIEVIQGGLGNDSEQPFAPIGHEDTEETGIDHRDGVLSMARNELGTASSEFFICVGDQPGLDKGASRHADGQGFAAFGRVIEGMDVVRDIHGSPTSSESYSEYTRGQFIAEPVIYYYYYYYYYYYFFILPSSA